jgi:hypothetical protein
MSWSDVDLTILPPRTAREVRGFVEHGRLPNPSLTAILCNDLRGYFEHRDIDRLHHLYLIWRVMEFAPAESWGSMQAVRDWTRRGGLLLRADPLLEKH